MRADELETLVMYFDIEDDKGETLVLQTREEAELKDYRVYLLKYIEGAWYWAYNDIDYRWECMEQEEVAPALLCGDVDPNKYDIDYQHYPLPSGHYALAICNELESLTLGIESAECYGLLEFDLVCEKRKDNYLLSQLTPPDTFYWNMPIEYKVENIGETIYYDPAKK